MPSPAAGTTPLSSTPTARAAPPRAETTMALAALGIVYGDLGTSPLYTYQAIVTAVGGHPSAADALGLLSLVIWALIVTVSLKYCLVVMRDVWRWSLPVALGVSGVFVVIDIVFFAANMLKLLEGGWIPLLLGALIFAAMTTWKRGIDALRQKLAQTEEAPERFLARLEDGRIPRVPGTAVFLSRTGALVPPVLVRHVAQFKAVQETIVGLTIRFEEVPRVLTSERAQVSKVAAGLWHVTVRYGFVEVPDLANHLLAARDHGCPLDLDDAVYFAGHDEVVRSESHPRLSPWRRVLFAFMYRNALRAPDRFDLPSDRFLEISRQVAL